MKRKPIKWMILFIKNKRRMNMKKLFKFKTTLTKIEQLGFKLTRQTEVNNHMVEMYERYDKKYKFNQIVYISKKSSNDKWYIQSYEDN